MPRFSRTATFAVGGVLLTGALGGLFELDGLTNLWTTRYGALLLFKIALALSVIALGFMTRRALMGLPAAGSVSRVRRTLGWELGVAAGVMVLTTLLVAQPPPRAVAAGPVTAQATVGDLDVRIVADPGRAGPNTVHVYLSRGDRSATADQVRLSAVNADADIGPISAPTTRAEPGHWVAESVPLTAGGDWAVRVIVRRGEFDADDAVVRLRLRGGSGG